MEPVSDDEFELSSGRKFYAHRLMLSINKELEIGYGADGDLYPEGLYYADDREDVWTEEERQEVADYMIELWTRFKKY